MVNLYRNMPIMYVAMALVVLAIGVGINRLLGGAMSGNVDPMVSLISLLMIYTALHVMALAVATLVALITTNPARALIFAILSFSLLATSIFIFRVKGEIHLLVIFAASLFLISVYYLWLEMRLPSAT